MHSKVKGQVLSGRQCHTRGGNALDRWIIGQVGKQHRAVDGAGTAELINKEFRFLKGDTDGGENYSKVALAIQYPRLTGNLSRQLGVRQTGAGEDRQLLPSYQGVQAINGRDAGLDKLIGVVAGGWVHCQTIDIPVFIRQNSRTIIDGLAHSVKYTAQHIAGNRQLQRVTQKPDLGLRQVDAGGSLKQLHHGGIAVDLQHLAAAGGTVCQFDLRQFIIGHALHMVHYHQRTGDLPDRFIFTDHSVSSPFCASASSSSSIWVSSLSYSSS